MYKIQNRQNKFRILYLKERSIRVKGKGVFEITNKEFNSKKFKMVADSYRIMEEPKKTISKEPKIAEEIEEND